MSNLVNYSCLNYLVRYCSKLISELVTSGHHLFSRCNLVAPKGLLCRGVQNLCSSGVCPSVCLSVRLLQPFLDRDFGSFTTGIGRFEGPKSGQNCANRPKWTRNLVPSRLVLDGSRSKNGSETHTIDTSGPPYPVGVI